MTEKPGQKKFRNLIMFSQKRKRRHVHKVNVADLETVTDLDFLQDAHFFLLSHSNTYIFFSAENIKRGSLRTKALGNSPCPKCEACNLDRELLTKNTQTERY